MNALAQSPSPRPWLTRACERILTRVPCPDGRLSAQPLSPAPRRLLVVKVHGMGDAVLVRSVIEHLRQRNPALEIGVLAGDATCEILSLGGEFRLHRYSQKQVSMYSSLRMLDEIRHRAYDAALCFEQGSLAGAGFLRLTGIPQRAGFAAPGSVKGALLTHGVGFQPSSSMWQSFLRLGRLIDPCLPDSLAPVPLALTDHQMRAAESWLNRRIADRSARKVIFHLGSGGGQPFKRWPGAKFAALARELRRRDRKLCVILTGQQPEYELSQQFRSLYDGVAIDALHLGSIAMTAAVISHCDLLVSNDTGVMHLGAAMGTPTIGLFGATTPAQWAPLGPATAYVYSTSIKCSPCIDSYANRVPTHCANASYAECMTEINVEAVVAAARDVIAGGWLG